MAVARAVHFGARVPVLVPVPALDGPTAALGGEPAAMVLKYGAAARDTGPGEVRVSHDPQHACLVGDRFVLFERGATAGSHLTKDITLDALTREMAGGSELDQLTHELSRATPAEAVRAASDRGDPETNA